MNLVYQKLRILIFAFTLVISYSTLGQNLSGSTMVDPNTIHEYEYSDNFSHGSGTWSVGNGVILSQSFTKSPYVYKVTIQWGTGPVGGSVSFSDGSSVLEMLTVSITSSGGSGGGGITYDDVNHIHKIVPFEAASDHNGLNNNQKLETYTYFDGLGRPIQKLDLRAGGNQEDIITHIGYDDFGRLEKDFLPFTDTTNGGDYRQDAKASTLAFYNDTKFEDDFIGMDETDINPYSQKEFEASPLNAVLKQAAPGKDWKMGNGHEIGFDFMTNSLSEVKKYRVVYDATWDLNDPKLEGGDSYFPPNSLIKTVTYDENYTSGDAHKVIEFKNKKGQVVLKRTYGDSDDNMNGVIDSGEINSAHDTYYVYDMFSNLIYVIPPKAASLSSLPASGAAIPSITSQDVLASGDRLDLVAGESIVLTEGFHAASGSNFTASISSSSGSNALDELCYQYKYDHKNRLVEKKIPGKGWEYIVYNKLDQPILTQDANMRLNNEWLFTKYDALGRVAYTGILNQNSNRTSLQNDAFNFGVQYEERASTTVGGTQISYTNVSYPIQNITELHTINYYDSYTDTAGITVPSMVYAVSTNVNTQSLPTVSKVRVLETAHWITTVMGYDKKGRVIYSKSDNPYLQTTDENFMELDFVGKLKTSKNIHKKLNLSPQLTIQTEDFFTYDHMGRMEKHTQKINDGNEELIALNEYDELGQLKTKKVGNTATAPLQTVDYTYNIRGWLKTINDPSVADPNKLFAFKINYNTQDHGATPFYNGNISETEWRTANTDNSLKWYTYGYDALNRISHATDNLNRYSLNSLNDPVTYDKNGNITSILRKGHVVTNPLASNSGHFGTMDNLTYEYDSGNKLLEVTDAINLSNAVKGQFNDGNTNGLDYEYDSNGNLIKDLNKGIIGLNNTAGIEYNHLNLPVSVNVLNDKGDGIGDITYIYDATGVKLEKTAPGNVTQYAGNYIYKNGALEFFNQPEGYVEKVGADFKYVYQYKDHLGNIRLSYQDKNGDGDIDLTTDITNEIVEEKNYYPFGLEHKGYNNVVQNNNSIAQNFGFGNKENNPELGLEWMDFGARNYDAAIGRWMNIDPMAEKYYNRSSYNYTMNNPMFFIDPDGREVDVSTLVKGGKKEDTWLLVNLMANLSEMSGQVIGINTDNNNKSILTSEGCGDSGNCSENVSSYVDHLLGSEETINVFRSNNSSSAFKRGGKIYIGLNGKQIYGAQKALNKNGLDSKTFSTGMVFLHETLHTEIGASFFNSASDNADKTSDGVFPDPITDKAKASSTGPTVDRVNKFRNDLGLPIRYKYGSVQGTLYFEKDGTKKQVKYKYENIPD